MILVDTGVWIDWFRDHDTPAVQWLAEAVDGQEDIAICGVILTEILQGIAEPREFARVERVLKAFSYLPTTRKTYRLAAEIYRGTRRAGKTVRNTVDCIIAACAIINGVSLAQNDRDFHAIQSVCPLQLVTFPPQGSL